MKILPRLYRDTSDLQKMYALLRAGCSHQTISTYYAHPGDLKWWLFNWLDGQNPWQYIYIWDDPADSEKLLGWGLYAHWSAFDVFVQPELCDSALAFQINDWMEEKSTELARQQGHPYLQRMNVAETDQSLREHLSSHGFQHVPEDLLAMRCSIEQALPAPTLPEGYALRTIQAGDTVSRASAQHAAFRSGTSLQEYIQKYSHFMDSSGYPQGCDWAVIDSYGSVAAFCIVWPDPISQVGQIEPVGTHPDFQYQGLGKAVLFAGMRHLQNLGMLSSRICVLADNLAAIKLYESVGFRTVNRLWLHQKEV